MQESVSMLRVNPFNSLPASASSSSACSGAGVVVPPEIDAQRRHSIVKDSGARRLAAREMLSSLLDLVAQLTDDQFRALLPALFDGIRRLTAHARDPPLGQALAELFHRVAVLYGFSTD